MPNIKSAKKRMRTSRIKHKKNISVKSELKTCLKKCAAVISDKKKEEASRLVRETIGKISKAASQKIIHRNTASRKISQLMRKLNKAEV